MLRGGAKGDGRVKPGKLSSDGGVGRHYDTGVRAANYLLGRGKKEKEEASAVNA